jgi:hypothetical protein
MLRIAMAGLLLSGLYSDGAKRALADTVVQRRVADYLQDGWEIKAALAGPPRILVLQIGGNGVWCEMRDAAVPVTFKGIPQLLTASCAAIR